MIGSGLTFGMEGPNMEGTWYNPKTGDSFTVRNSFFEDNQYIVQTTDGRVLGYNQIQNYIKTDKPIDIPTVTHQSQVEELPAEVADLIETDYDAEIEELLSPMSLGNLADSSVHQTVNDSSIDQQIRHQSKNIDEVVIEKALSKCSLPNLQVGIEWENFPITETKMLLDLMEVKLNDIIDYYLSQVDLRTTTAMIHEVLRDHISKQLLGVDTTKPEPDPIVEESKEKPKSTKREKTESPKKFGGPKTPKTTTKTKKAKVNE